MSASERCGIRITGNAWCGLPVGHPGDHAHVPAAQRGPAEDEIRAECAALAEMLCAKNRKYGNSALEPARVFSKAPAHEQILVRLDDKLSRLRAAQADEDEDVVADLLGYLILYTIARKRAARAGGG